MSFPTTPFPPVLRPTALATHPGLTDVWPSSAAAILCPPTERQKPHGDNKGVMQVPAGNRIEEARARRDPPRITFLTAADPFGSKGPLTEAAQASENWVATRRLHDSRLWRAADPLASEGALARVVSVWFGFPNMNVIQPDSLERWSVQVECNMSKGILVPRNT